MPRLAPPLLLLLAAVHRADAVESTLTSAGFTGLGVTPNAHLIEWGRAEVTYDNQLAGVVRNPAGHNVALGFGLLPNLEVAGRLATSELNSNCFIGGCGAARDLSASAKVAIGIDANNRFRVAVGAADIGGAATFFRTYYGVLTANEGPFEASVGLARRAGAGVAGSRSPLDGPFAGLAWQPHPTVRTHIEYTDGNAWAGLRVFAPKAYLPEGWSLSAGANVRLNRNPLTERQWWTASVSIPLYKVPTLPTAARQAPLRSLAPGQAPLPAYEATNLPTPQPDGVAAAAVAQGADSLQALARQLQDKGLEDISVGRMPDGSIAIVANNGAYRWNSADALGAALGAISRTLGNTKTGYRLILNQGGVPLVAVTGQADCLRSWIDARDPTCTAGQLTTPGAAPLEPLHAGATWVVRHQNPGYKTVRVTVSPVLRTNVGTELGALDYSAGLNVAAQWPLWRGASVHWGHNFPVANSTDYEPQGAFSRTRVRSATDSLALTQTVRVPLEQWLGLADDGRALGWGLSGLTAQATAGRVGTFYDGVHASLRWEPGEGRHRFSAEAGRFDNNTYAGGTGPLGTLRTATPLLASYRYHVVPTRTYLEGTVGQFMNNDRGLQVGLRQWFTDVSLGLYYKRTAFRGESTRQIAGIELTVPIGPRRDWKPLANLQVGGTPRFGHAVETVVRSTVNPVLSTRSGARPPVDSLVDPFNADRSGLVYFEDNIRRIRDAAR